MPASSLSVGRMISYAYDRAARTPVGRPGVPRRSRRDSLARHMLEYVLMDPVSRAAFSRRVADSRGEPLEFRTSSRADGDRFDLVAQLADRSADAGRIAVILRTDDAPSAEEVTSALAAIGPSPASRLVVVVPKGRKPDLPAPEPAPAEAGDADADADADAGNTGASPAQDPRLVILTWKALAKELARRAKDPTRAELWRVLGEFGEDSPGLTVHRLVAPRILLETDLVAEFRAQLDAMRLVTGTLFGRPARFSTRRGPDGAWLHAGGSGEGLGVELGEVEDGTPIWFVGSRPHRTFPLGIGALPDEHARAEAERRLQAIAAGGRWRTDPSYRPQLGGLIGLPASRAFEDARALLWEVMDPEALAEAGFPLVARHQPGLDEQRLAVRVRSTEHPRSGTFLVAIGGSRTWRTLLPRVTREFDGRTYIVQAKKNDDASDLLAGVHGALHSLATKP